MTILLKRNIQGELNNILIDAEGRYVLFDYIQNNMKITIVAIYAPNDDNPQFFTSVGNHLEK